eukprot:5618867-Prymnesium_polylepis.3
MPLGGAGGAAPRPHVGLHAGPEPEHVGRLNDKVAAASGPSLPSETCVQQVGVQHRAEALVRAHADRIQVNALGRAREELQQARIVAIGAVADGVLHECSEPRAGLVVTSRDGEEHATRAGGGAQLAEAHNYAKRLVVWPTSCMAVLISVTRGVSSWLLLTTSWRRDLKTQNFDPFSPHYPLHQNATQAAH